MASHEASDLEMLGQWKRRAGNVVDAVNAPAGRVDEPPRDISNVDDLRWLRRCIRYEDAAILAGGLGKTTWPVSGPVRYVTRAADQSDASDQGSVRSVAIEHVLLTGDL